MTGVTAITETILARGLGEWTGPEKMPPAPWAPDGMTATGHISAHAGVGGSALVSAYRQESDDGTAMMHAHSVFTVDPGSGDVVMHFFSSMGGEPQVMRGRADGNALVLEGVGPGGRMRHVFRYGDGTMEVESLAEADDGGWTKLFEGRYVRSRKG